MSCPYNINETIKCIRIIERTDFKFLTYIASTCHSRKGIHDGQVSDHVSYAPDIGQSVET